MIVNEKKLLRQNEGVDKWFKHECNGILDYHTGVGKTFTAILCIKAIELIKKSTYLIVVPGPDLLKQWNEELENLLPKSVINRITVVTYSTILLQKLKYEVDVQIVDEIHECSSEERIKIIDGTYVTAPKFLGLTASGDDKNFRKITRHYKIIDLITAEEALQEGYVAPFIEYNLAVDLTLREKELYDHYTEIISKMMPMFSNHLEYANYVLFGGKHSNGAYYSGPGWARGLAAKHGWEDNMDLTITKNRDINRLYNPNNFIGYAKALTNAVRGRKTLLCTATAKFHATLDILKKIDKVKTILFSESTEFADKIAVMLNKNNIPTAVFHSSLKSIKTPSEKTGKLITLGKVRLKKRAIEQIKTGKVRAISTAKALDKGLDVVDLRMAVTTSGTQNTTQNKQRSGRPTRQEDCITSDVPVLLVNVYVKNTQDEKWLHSRQELNKHTSIEITSVDEITYSPPSNKEFTLKDL